MADIDIGDIIRQISGGLKSAKYKGPTEQAAEYREEMLQSHRKDIEGIRAEEIAKRMEGVKSEHAVRLAQAGDPGMLERLKMTEAGLGERAAGAEVGSLARQRVASEGQLDVAKEQSRAHLGGIKTQEEARRELGGQELKSREYIAEIGVEPDTLKKTWGLQGRGPAVGGVTPGQAARASLPGAVSTTSPFVSQGVTAGAPLGGEEMLTGMPALGTGKKKTGKTGFAALLPDPKKYRLGF